MFTGRLTRPADLPEHESGHLTDLLAACPHLTALAEHVHAFADMLTTRRGDESGGLDERGRDQ